MNNWSWTEVSDEEFEKRRMTEDYYKIFKLVPKKPEPSKITVYKFWAKSRASALAVLKRFRADHSDGPYYYSRSGWCIDPTGKRHDDLDDMISPKTKTQLAKRRKDAQATFVQERDKIFKGIPQFIRSLHLKDKNLRFVADDILYFLKNYDLLSNRSHQICEKWSIDHFVLETLEFNLPLLIEKKTGLPSEYCELARKQLGEPSNENGSYSRKATKLAEKLWNAELEKLLLYVRLYRFYTEFGIIDKRKSEEVSFHDAYAHTLPYLEGTYQELDYRKLRKLCDKYWNLWIAQYHKIGRNLWD